MVGEKRMSHTKWGGEQIVRASMITITMGWGQDRSSLAQHYNDNVVYPLIKIVIMYVL